jgi:hypothetical protein
MVDALLLVVRCVFEGSTLLGASPQGGRCVAGRTLGSQAKYLLNTHSLGHLLSVDAVLWDVRCALKGSICSIDTPWVHLFREDAVL